MDWLIFFHMVLTHKELFFGFVEVTPQNIFNNAVQTNLWILIKKFSDKYKRIPDFDTLEIILENLPDTEKENRKVYLDLINKIRNATSTVDIDVFSDQLTKIIQTYELEQFILRSANKIGTITPADMMGDMRSIMLKFAPKSMGMDVTDVERSIKAIRQDHFEKQPTGIAELDRALYGGYGSDEITIVMAPPGKGKSFFLINAMYYSLLAGKNVLYVTLELSERAVIRRLYSRIACANKKELKDEGAVASLAGKFFSYSKGIGRVIYCPGRSLSVAGLEALIEQQDLYFGFKPNVLIIDYIDRLAPSHIDMRSEVRHQLRNITDDLRSISLRSNMQVISATQANRESLKKETISEANMSESFGKVEVADVILAICQTEEEKAEKKARLIVVKNRDNVSGGIIEFFCDFDKMFLSDLATAEKLGIMNKPILERLIT